MVCFYDGPLPSAQVMSCCVASHHVMSSHGISQKSNKIINSFTTSMLPSRSPRPLQPSLPIPITDYRLPLTLSIPCQRVAYESYYVDISCVVQLVLHRLTNSPSQEVGSRVGQWKREDGHESPSPGSIFRPCLLRSLQHLHFQGFVRSP